MTMDGSISKPYRSLSEIYAEMQLQQKAVISHGITKMQSLPAIICVTLTTIIMAYSSLMGFVSVLVFYAIWFMQLYIRGLKVLQPTRAVVLVLALPFLACLSTLWSSEWKESLHHGVEFLSMAICVVIISRTVSREAFLKGFILGAIIILMATMIDGTYGRDYFSNTYSLVGLFGSKNQVGSVSVLGILSSIALLISSMSKIKKLFFCILPVLYFIVPLFLSKSATAVMTLILDIGVLFVLYLVTRLHQNIRWGALLVAVTLIGLLVLLVFNSGLQDEILAGFGKDSTLTGRTYLWSEGIKDGLKHPVLGEGYGAFWIPGNPLAERYWYEFGIFNKTGFHFHNLLIQTFVDMGLVGLVVITFLILFNVSKSVLCFVKEGPGMETLFAVTISILYLIRAFVEVDFLGPFGTSTLLFYSMPMWLVTGERENKRPS